MTQLYSDLQDGSGRRYYFGLTTAAGGISNASPAMLTLFGNLGTIQEQNTVFRTPATAALSLIGNNASAEPHLSPAPAALAYQGKIAGLLTLKIVTNALPPDYTSLPDNPPTIVYIATISPGKATLTTQSLEHNITEGGNIGFMSPAKATLTLSGLIANMPRFADVGTLTINGLQASIFTELAITPDPAGLVLSGLDPSLGTPFVWIDDDPVGTPTWIDDTPA